MNTGDFRLSVQSRVKIVNNIEKPVGAWFRPFLDILTAPMLLLISIDL
jgi:hypothetical protein